MNSAALNARTASVAPQPQACHACKCRQLLSRRVPPAQRQVECSAIAPETLQVNSLGLLGCKLASTACTVASASTCLVLPADHVITTSRFGDIQDIIVGGAVVGAVSVALVGAARERRRACMSGRDRSQRRRNAGPRFAPGDGCELMGGLTSPTFTLDLAHRPAVRGPEEGPSTLQPVPGHWRHPMLCMRRRRPQRHRQP